MKKLVFPALLMITISSMTSAQTKPVKKPVKPAIAKPAAAKPAVTTTPVVLKTLQDSASYAMGLSAATSFKNDGLPALKPTLVCKGIDDVQKGKQVLFDDQTGYNIWVRFTNDLKEKKAAAAKPGMPVKTVKPAAKTLPANALLKTTIDSVCYAIGVNRAMFAKQQGVSDINTALFSAAMNEVQTGKKTLFDETVGYNVMNAYLTKIEEEKSKPNIQAGEDFLARNKLRAGVITTASGLQYEVLKDSAGIKPTALDTFVCHYRGTLLDGTEFDASYNRHEPLTMAVRDVIRGWTEGLQLMNTGSKYKFFIPYTLAYGPYGNNGIPGGSMLIFEVELLDVKKAKTAMP